VDGRLDSRPFLRHSGPVRPAVRPGAVVLRRDVDHLQVGTSPGVVVRDRPGLYPFLRGLDGTHDLAALRRTAARDHPDLDADIVEILAPLVAAGAVVDLPDIASPRLRIAVRHDRPSTAFAQTVSSLITELDLELVPEPDLTLMISSGEPPRIPFADAVRMGITHLVVVLDGDEARIGPFVVPGRTPCLDCLDLQRAAWDPAWPVLLAQFVRAARNSVSALTQHAAAAEVAAECMRFAEGRQPRSASEVVAMGPARTLRTVSTSRVHPHCACSLLSVL